MSSSGSNNIVNNNNNTATSKPEIVVHSDEVGRVIELCDKVAAENKWNPKTKKWYANIREEIKLTGELRECFRIK